MRERRPIDGYGHNGDVLASCAGMCVCFTSVRQQLASGQGVSPGQTAAAGKPVARR